MTRSPESPLRPTSYIRALPLRGRVARPQPKGLPVINLGFNELPFGPSPKVAAAIAQVPIFNADWNPRRRLTSGSSLGSRKDIPVYMTT